jgi:uncharacterized delta-60 repeat protein
VIIKTFLPRHLVLVSVSALLGSLFVPAIHTSASSTHEFLDTTFGTQGIVRADYNNDRHESIRDMVLQPDGKAVVAVEEFCFAACTNGFAVARHNADGTLDHTFNGTGFARTPVGNDRDAAEAIALQPDGKIVVAGTSEDAQGDGRFGMLRYNPNGTIDTSFGINGIVITDIANFTEFLRDIVIQPDGKIVLVGISRIWTGSAYERRWLVIRYNDDGTLDTNFATNGVYQPLTHVGWATSVAQQPDGKIVVAGQKDFNVGVLRLNIDGTPDSGFGTNGFASVNFGSLSIAADVVLQPDGKIVTSGEYDTGALPQMFVARFTEAGQLDTSFGGVGYIQPSWGYNEIDINRMVIDADNKVLVTGVAQFPNNIWDIFLTRFHSDGTLDTTFYSTGHIRLEDPDYEEALGMAITSEGKIIIAGLDETVNSTQSLLLRINPSVPPAATTTTTTTTVPVVVRAAATSAPLALAYRAANKKVTLRWRAVEGATSYVVTTTSGTQVCATAATSCAVSRLRNGRAYNYLVYSVNADGVRSDNSTRLTARPGFQVKRTTLKAKRSLKLSSIVTTPSKGAKTWRVTSGRCRISGTRLIAPPARGTCRVRLATAKAGSYAAMSTTINISVTR